MSADAAVRRTPLHDEHVALGARMVEFAGWAMPVQYSSILTEHAAVRGAAGIFDVSHMGEVEIAGPNAEALCAKLFTNDARVLVPGKAQYSMIPTDEGTVVDDIIVYRLAPERFLVCVNASNAAKDLAWIQSQLLARPMEGATVTDLSDRTALVAVQGPKAATIVERIAPGAASLGRMSCEERELGGVRVVVARSGYTGEDGFEIFCPAESVVALWRTLLEHGKEDGLVPCGLGARDTLRIEAALPLYGHELGGDISPYEVRVGWAVKRNRPDMVGFAALEKAAKDAPRRLVGLHVEGGIAREGAPVFVTGQSQQVGVVTSGTHSPTLGRAVAMALVTKEAAAAANASAAGASGTPAAFEVEVRGKRRAAPVTDLPFCVKRPHLQ